MTLKIFFLFALTLSSTAFAKTSLELESSLENKVVASCKPTASKKHVWLFKQWHLSPSVDTKDFAKAAALPQAKNQTSIYQQLDRWITDGKLSFLVAEGCTGELTADSNLTFNGWTGQMLKAEASKAHYAEIISNVALKLEAKHGETLKTLCGDDPALLKENSLAFSDARGALGFLTRLDQHKNDPARAKNYLAGVIEIYKLPKTTTIQQALARLKKELKSSLSRVQSAIKKRDAMAFQGLKQLTSPESAIVFGGLHTKGIVALLEKNGVNCTVVEPAGYQNSENELLEQLENLIRAL